MIRYQLSCDQEHAFESWFRDSAAFDDQSARGLLACPLCGSERIGKALMAPRLVKSGKRPEKSPAGEGGVPPASIESSLPVLVSPEEQAVRAKMRDMREHLIRNSDYVGPRFAAEARRMHEGDVEHRTIHGEASPAEVRGLMEDGVPVHALPILPEDRN